MPDSSPSKSQTPRLARLANEFGADLLRLLTRFSNLHPELTVGELYIIVTTSYDWLGDQLNKLVPRLDTLSGTRSERRTNSKTPIKAKEKR